MQPNAKKLNSETIAIFSELQNQNSQMSKDIRKFDSWLKQTFTQEAKNNCNGVLNQRYDQNFEKNKKFLIAKLMTISENSKK